MLDNTISKDALISSLRSMSQAATDPQPVTSNDNQFSSLLKNAVQQVSDRQLSAGGMAAEFEQGDSLASLSDVMVEIQKARISFEALTQVRNKFVAAYQQIMSMPL